MAYIRFLLERNKASAATSLEVIAGKERERI